MKYKIAPGVFDIIPEDDKEPWKSSYLWNYVEKVIKEAAQDFGYQEIRTPIFERTELFIRSVGETTDIVSKEMFTFEDRGKRSITLRPEGTACVMRAILEHRLENKAPQHRLYYIGPMFRYERSQAGRYRQHHQFGVEAIGIKEPEQDAEVIDLIHTVYQRLGIKNLKVSLNTLGSLEDRLSYREKLTDYFSKHKNSLSEDSQKRLQVNPLRILDSKAEKDIQIVKDAPVMLDFVCNEALAHFDQLKELLSDLNIEIEVNPRLVRGLDYYNYTVFEITSGELGAQNSIVGGGRYDGLLKSLGGPDLPAIGFGAGIERIIQTMLKQMIYLKDPTSPTVCLIPLGEKAKKKCFKLLHDLRSNGISCQMNFNIKKLAKAMNYANQLRAKYVAVIGDNELETGSLNLKEMETGDEIPIPIENMQRILKLDQEMHEHIQSWKELSEPFRSDVEKSFFTRKLSDAISETNEATVNLKQALKNLEDIVKP